jgi:hypothetical protein
MDRLVELRALIERHAGDRSRPTALAGIALTSSSTPTEALGEVSEPELVLIAQGSKRAVLGDTVFD